MSRTLSRAGLAMLMVTTVGLVVLYGASRALAQVGNCDGVWIEYSTAMCENMDFCKPAEMCHRQDFPDCPAWAGGPPMKYEETTNRIMTGNFCDNIGYGPGCKECSGNLYCSEVKVYAHGSQGFCFDSCPTRWYWYGGVCILTS